MMTGILEIFTVVYHHYHNCHSLKLISICAVVIVEVNRCYQELKKTNVNHSSIIGLQWNITSLLSVEVVSKPKLIRISSD